MHPDNGPLSALMKPYESTQHSVAAVTLQHGAPKFVSTGAPIPRAPCEKWIFEIGSITKVFTAILLCVLTEENKVDPRAPLRDMSDRLADVPSWITPESLTTHTSGLPRLHVPVWKALIKPLPEDPYADFSRADLLDWLQHWRGSAPRSKRRHAYSNLGVGLLGEAMAMMEGVPFADLLAEKVTAPMGLKDTVPQLDQDQRARFAHPRNTKGTPVADWTFDAMAAAGCLRSTTSDLARFSARCLHALEEPSTTLDRAICRSATPIFGLGLRGAMTSAAQCSGWFANKLTPNGPRILHHTGGTAGSTCALFICPEKAQAIAVLSNNGIAANLWASIKLDWSNQIRQAHDIFSA